MTSFRTNQPQPPTPDHIRYTTRPFPPYRFVPGHFPHPRRDPKGHSYDHPEPSPPPIDPHRWHESETYLYGIDLFNFAYWWECHEELESLWHAVGHNSEMGVFLQGIVQVAAANLRRFMEPDNPDAGVSLMQKGLEKLQDYSGVYLGVDVERFRRMTEDYFGNTTHTPPTITLIDIEQRRQTDHAEY
ncbi:MAG: DUF309 domain-containing protein [candidate division Zixibacteria bacterium]|nr:DUF309 domain-containing protein [candidate division Zixibacteria bacterium]